MSYTFEDGQWGSYDDGIEGPDFHRHRERLGFTASKKLECLLGSATLYSRQGVKVKWPYPFLCMISLPSGNYYPIWIKNLPSVFQFLREIGAHEPESYPENHVEGLIDYLSGSYFNEAMRSLYKHFEGDA